MRTVLYIDTVGNSRCVNDGFVSTCDVPYPELVDACRRTASGMYPQKYGRNAE